MTALLPEARAWVRPEHAMSVSSQPQPGPVPASLPSWTLHTSGLHSVNNGEQATDAPGTNLPTCQFASLLTLAHQLPQRCFLLAWSLDQDLAGAPNALHIILHVFQQDLIPSLKERAPSHFVPSLDILQPVLHLHSYAPASVIF